MADIDIRTLSASLAESTINQKRNRTRIAKRFIRYLLLLNPKSNIQIQNFI